MRLRTTAGLVASGLSLVLGASLGLSSTASAADGGGSASARAALSQAKAVMSGRADGREASMVLRDLFLSANDLSGADAKQARTILARPTDPGDGDYYGDGVSVKTECGEFVCVHWAETGAEATEPGFASLTLDTLEAVHGQYVAAGYRAPLPDKGQGGSTLTDIYLANMGDEGLYGYCTTDVDAEGNPDWVDGSTVAPYCAMDNDFSAAEFPTNTPVENMQVTAAHEYFHAVQFAYNAIDDAWIYETTATWAEDEVFDDINDNWNYLPYGQMGDPAAAASYEGEGPLVPLDYAAFPYGNFIFFRYLTETFPGPEGGMSSLVRELWENLDSTGGAPETYSLLALEKTLRDHGTTTKQQYADFAVANRTPSLSYEEGADYPTPAPAFRPVALSKAQRSKTKTMVLDHLTSGSGAFLPFAKGWKLRLAVDMAPKKTGSMAVALVFNNDGTVDRKVVSLNKKGNGVLTLPFASHKVSAVEVTMVNASTAMSNCFTDPDFQFSCGGFGTYDGSKAKVTATAVK